MTLRSFLFFVIPEHNRFLKTQALIDPGNRFLGSTVYHRERKKKKAPFTPLVNINFSGGGISKEALQSQIENPGCTVESHGGVLSKRRILRFYFIDLFI